MRLRCRGSSVLLLLALLAAAPVARAQDRPARGRGSIAGTIIDSTSGKPAAGAMVYLTRLASDSADFRSAITDVRGRFRFDTLAAGHYSISFDTPYLDSLDITMPDREIVLADGEVQQVELATPSGAMLREVACPDMHLAHGRGAVLGHVTDADSDRPLTTAHVIVSWTELSADPKTARAITTRRNGEVTVDSLGRYRLCGVPTGTYLMLQVQDHGRAGSVITLSVGDAGGVTARDLSLSSESARTIVSLDSAAALAARDTVPVLPLLTGTATLSGTVRDVAGQPLSGATLRIRDAAGSARSDSLGRFVLSGQPAGSQLLEVRRVGYLLGRIPVELHGGRTTDADITLARIVSLDSVRVVARRNSYEDFDRRRKEGFGRFLDEDYIERQHAYQTTELLRMVPGFRVEGADLDAKVFTTHGAFDLSFMGQNRCEVNIVINGINQHQDINLINPADIGAIEAYPGPAGAPVHLDRACGVIVIWLKKVNAPPPKEQL